MPWYVARAVKARLTARPVVRSSRNAVVNVHLSKALCADAVLTQQTRQGVCSVYVTFDDECNQGVAHVSGFVIRGSAWNN